MGACVGGGDGEGCAGAEVKGAPSEDGGAGAFRCGGWLGVEEEVDLGDWDGWLRKGRDRTLLPGVRWLRG